jgi:hypothetical protein
MRVGKFSFGSIRIDGTTYEHDVVIDHDRVHKRKNLTPMDPAAESGERIDSGTVPTADRAVGRG